MNKETWHRRYIQRLVIKGQMTFREAKDILEAGMGNYYYDDDPEDSADDEMSYWSDDG